MTGYTTSIQACHLCPRTQADLFRQNNMDIYNLEEYNRFEYYLDDSANGIILRADLHLHLEAGSFVLMRKSDSGYTLHCLKSSVDILPMFHNHKIHLMTNVRPEFIYARLAYAILLKVGGFLSRPGLPKRIIHLKAGSGTETEFVDITAKEFTKQAQSQNRIRKERSPADSPPADDHSYAQELSLDLNPASSKKRKLTLTSTSTCSSQLSAPSVFGSSSTAPLSPNDFQDLKNSWIVMQRPLDYVPPQKRDSHRGMSNVALVIRGRRILRTN